MALPEIAADPFWTTSAGEPSLAFATLTPALVSVTAPELDESALPVPDVVADEELSVVGPIDVLIAALDVVGPAMSATAPLSVSAPLPETALWLSPAGFSTVRFDSVSAPSPLPVPKRIVADPAPATPWITVEPKPEPVPTIVMPTSDTLVRDMAPV